MRSTALDGSDLREIRIDGVERAFSVEVAGDRLFVADNSPRSRGGKVVSASLEGGTAAVLLDGLNEVSSLEVFGGRLYAASRLQNPARGLIRSIPLEGGEPRVELESEEALVWQIHVEAESPQVPGDCSQDGLVDIADGLCILGFLYGGEPASLPCGTGLATDEANVALIDWQGDGAIDMADAVALLRGLFLGGEGPPGTPVGACKTISGCLSGPGC